MVISLFVVGIVIFIFRYTVFVNDIYIPVDLREWIADGDRFDELVKRPFDSNYLAIKYVKSFIVICIFVFEISISENYVKYVDDEG